MRIIENADTVTYTDPDGDTLTLLVSVRHRDVVKRSELESREAMDGLKDLGLSMTDALALEKESTPAELEAARNRRAKSEGDRSPAVLRYMLQAIAQGMRVGEKDIAQSAILDSYDKMDPESAAWVDAQVDGVWTRATPGADDRAKPDASAGIV